MNKIYRHIGIKPSTTRYNITTGVSLIRFREETCRGAGINPANFIS
jgi:hypothetical protein